MEDLDKSTKYPSCSPGVDGVDTSLMTGSGDHQMNRDGSLEEAINKCWHRISARFRRKREEQFLALFPAEKFSSLIDIGGLATQWKNDPRDITILNVMPQAAAHCRVIVGDGRHSGLLDSSFDIAYSQSAIEHVGGWEDQVALASELRRIGRAIYCQTPNRWFPLEVHYLTFFLHWHPKILRNYFVVRFLTGWGWLVRPDRQRVREYASQVNLLTPAQMKQLFPDCIIRKEKFLGMTKSLIAIRSALPPDIRANACDSSRAQRKGLPIFHGRKQPDKQFLFMQIPRNRSELEKTTALNESQGEK